MAGQLPIAFLIRPHATPVTPSTALPALSSLKVHSPGCRVVVEPSPVGTCVGTVISGRVLSLRETDNRSLRGKDSRSLREIGNRSLREKDSRNSREIGNRSLRGKDSQSLREIGNCSLRGKDSRSLREIGNRSLRGKD